MLEEIGIITPPPTPFCGVTDHTNALALQFERVGTRTRIVRLSRGGLPKEPNGLIVQVSLYGYQDKGVPLDLVSQLRNWIGRGGKFVPYFHELWVPAAPINTSAYWLKPAQQWVCRWLAKNGVSAHFNTRWAHSWGLSMVGANAHYSPTFSNVGESERPRLLTDRRRTLVCFGAPQRRAEGYAALLRGLERGPRMQILDEIVDIGAGGGLVPSSSLQQYGISTRILGAVAASTVSKELAAARYGLHFTPWSLATKSGIYGALVAHGVLPVSIYDYDTLPLPSDNRGPTDRLLGMNRWLDLLWRGNEEELLLREIQGLRNEYKSCARLANEVSTQLSAARSH